ncbi:MAG: bifunctional DNA-formamidopyrimidine glycosylase/DNA-(apurinic or apyrimidinic site) lyase [Phycisphaerales bacterium]
MPELPEVESIRRSLLPRVVGKRVVGAVLHRRDVLTLPGDPAGGFARQRLRGTLSRRPTKVSEADLLVGARITAIERRGKQLAVIGVGPDPHADQRALIVQLGMSGQFFHREPAQALPVQSHVHAVWTLEDGGRIVFRDPRRFGGLRAIPGMNQLRELWSSIGPDALTISPRELGAALRNSRRPIKPTLLDQSRLAGVGNIYADEALFAARISPHRLSRSLDRREVHNLAGSIRRTLREAVAHGGSTLRDYLDAAGNPGAFQRRHSVYGRGGQPCRSCGCLLRQAMIAQRTTVWCPFCQR